jgi:hypothetical protein
MAPTCVRGLQLMQAIMSPRNKNLGPKRAATDYTSMMSQRLVLASNEVWAGPQRSGGTKEGT